jgi:hypothetical protein
VNDGYAETVYTFANNINTHEGGTHLSGFRSALTRTINFYAGKNNLAKDLKDASISGDDIREGLTAVISVKIPRPQFEADHTVGAPGQGLPRPLNRRYPGKLGEASRDQAHRAARYGRQSRSGAGLGAGRAPRQQLFLATVDRRNGSGAQRNLP